MSDDGPEPTMSDGGRWVPPNRYSYGASAAALSRKETKPGPLNPVGMIRFGTATGSSAGLSRYAERQRQRVESERNARHLVDTFRSTPLKWSDAGYSFGRAPPPPSRASVPKRIEAQRPQMQRPKTALISDKDLHKWAECVHRWHTLRCGERPEGGYRRSQPREIMAETAEELFRE